MRELRKIEKIDWKELYYYNEFTTVSAQLEVNLKYECKPTPPAVLDTRYGRDKYFSAFS